MAKWSRADLGARQQRVSLLCLGLCMFWQKAVGMAREGRCTRAPKVHPGRQATAAGGKQAATPAITRLHIPAMCGCDASGRGADTGSPVITTVLSALMLAMSRAQQSYTL